MSAYENVVGGKLKLKGKALDVKAAGLKKKKKKMKMMKQLNNNCDQSSSILTHTHLSAGESTDLSTDPSQEQEEAVEASKATGDSSTNWDAHLTPAERRYMEQRANIDHHRLAKTANKSHRDRIQDFNQYLANLSEHYDIPKVGPG